MRSTAGRSGVDRRSRHAPAVAALAVLGGLMIGARLGASFPLFTGIPSFLLIPSESNLGFAHASATIGAVVGALFGIPVGAVGAGVLAIAFFQAWPKSIAVSVSASVVALLCVTIGLFAPGDPVLWCLVGLAASSATGGLILLTWIAHLPPTSSE